MPVPLLTKGFQVAPVTAEAVNLETSLGRSLSTTSYDALYYSPTSSIYRSSRLGAIAEQTGGFSGVGGAPTGVTYSDLSKRSLEQRQAKFFEARKEAIDNGLWISEEDGAAQLEKWGLSPKDVGLTSTGMNAVVFQYVLEANKEERKRHAVMANAAAGVVGSTLRFGTSLAASMVDPINLGSSFIPILGQAKYANVANTVGNRSLRAMQRGREMLARGVVRAGMPEGGLLADDIAVAGMRAFSTTRRALNRGIIPLEEATTLGGRTLQRAGVGAVEGLVGAALVEPFVLEAASLEQLDYSMTDSYMNVLFGSVVGGGLHMGLGAVSDALSRGRTAATAKPQGIMAEAINDIDPNTHNMAARAAIGQTESGKNIDVSLVLAQDPRLASPLTPRYDPVPFGIVEIADAQGNVSARRIADAGDHVIARATQRSDAIALKALNALPEAIKRQKKLEAVVTLLRDDKPGLGGIKTSAGNDTILNAMSAEGGIKGRTQFDKKARQDKAFKKEYAGAPEKGVGAQAMKGEGGLTPKEMAMRLKSEYGLGDGTTGKMWSLLSRDVKERARLGNALDQALTEQALLPQIDAGRAGGIQSDTLAKAVGLEQQVTVASRLEATRRALTEDGNAGAIRIAQEADSVSNLRGYDPEASKAGQRSIEELPEIETSQDIDADIASLNDELIVSGIDPDVIARELDGLGTLVDDVNQRSDAFSQAMICGLGKGN